MLSGAALPNGNAAFCSHRLCEILHKPSGISPMLKKFASMTPLFSRSIAWSLFAILFATIAGPAIASEADLAIPDLNEGKFNIFGTTITAWNLLFYGSFVILGTLGISIY